MDFLAEANGAGQLLLRLVSRGNAILAELLRLSDNIPQAYRPENSQEYAMLIFDFSYLNNEELYEKRISDNPDLIERNENLKDMHIKILRRFYNVFESIVNYYKDLSRYLSELDDGVFIQLSMETLLDNEDGKQLMSEAIYLWCVMLTLLDELIPGSTREKMVMSYLRYKGHAELPGIDDVCTLCKSTGYQSARTMNGLNGLANMNKRPPNYPIAYFSRFPLPASHINLLIGRLRSDDIYNATRAYPQPEFRSVALSQQAAMLYLILYLTPKTLNNENAVMREIVDKYFPDNWVITYYLGFTADLSQQWEPYKAARAAIQNTMVMSNITNTSQMYWENLVTLGKEVEAYLVDGVLTEDYIMDHMNKLLNCVRACNVTIRWLLLHTSSACVNRKVSEAVSASVKTGGGPNFLDRILTLLLNAAQFEFIMKNAVQTIMESKETRWTDCKREAASRLDELGDFFSGEGGLTRVQANKTLGGYFHDLAREIDALDVKDSAVANGRKMSQMRYALQDVVQFHNMESNLQVRAFLEDVRNYLGQMLRLVNVGPSVMGVLDFVSDFSYAWDVLRENNSYIAQMQKRIRENPTLMLKLRSVLVKLSSILNGPLVRINQANSKDLVSVSAFYSDELVAYVRKVLEIIPRTVFEILNQVIRLQTTEIPELSAKVEKEHIREFAQFDNRFKLAQLTYQISVFTEGILAMETTLVGVDRVIPKQLLEDGIRKELVFRVASCLDRVLVFQTDKIEELEKSLQIVDETLDGYCRSFQYIQDYIRLQGLQVWQEEFMRIVNFYVEQECAAFLVKKGELDSVYQSREVPIPVFKRTDAASVNFMGRLARALLIHTDYSNTVYIPDMCSWYDFSSSAVGRQLVGPTTFQLLLRGLNVFGISGLDQLFCFMVVKRLRVFITRLGFAMKQDKELLKQLIALFSDMSPLSTIPKEAARKYEIGLKLVKRIQPDLLSCVSEVGQIQLIREQIASTLRLSSKTDAGALHGILGVFNDSLMKDVQAHYKDPDNLPYPDPESPLLPEITRYLETAGISDCLTKIYVTTEGTDVLPLIIFFVLLSIIGEYQYNPMLGVSVSSTKKAKNRRDSTALIVGIVTVLRQSHSSHMLSFVQLCGQYIRSQLNSLGFQMREKKDIRLPAEVRSLLYFLETMLKYARISSRAVDSALPPSLFHFIEQF